MNLDESNYELMTHDKKKEHDASTADGMTKLEHVESVKLRLSKIDWTQYEKRKSIRGKPFAIMNDEERKMRIDYLWARVRIYIALKRVIASV